MASVPIGRREGSRYVKTRNQEILFDKIEGHLQALKGAQNLLQQAPILREIGRDTFDALDDFIIARNPGLASAILGLWEEAMTLVFWSYLERMYDGDTSAYLWDLSSLYGNTLNRNYVVPAYMNEVLALRIHAGDDWNFVERVIRGINQDTLVVQSPSTAQPDQRQRVADRLLFMFMHISVELSHRYENWKVYVDGRMVPASGVHERITRPPVKKSSLGKTAWTWLKDQARRMRIGMGILGPCRGGRILSRTDEAGS